MLRFSIASFGSTPAHGSGEMPVWGPIFRHQVPQGDAGVKLRVYNLLQYVKPMQAK